MAVDNTVTVTGNITRDPELRFTSGGTPVATFGLACNRRWQNRQTNEFEEQVSFFDVTCWNSLAEKCERKPLQRHPSDCKRSFRATFLGKPKMAIAALR